MFKQLAVILVTLTCQAAMARDAELELSVALVLHALDHAQTIEITRQEERYHERNPLMSRIPTRGEVNRYFLTTAAIGITAHYLLPERYAVWSDRIWITVGAGTVARNYSIGLRFGF